MAPVVLPPIWDPAAAVDPLPQPFRMLDKLVAEILDKVLAVVDEKEAARRAEEASRVDLVGAKQDSECSPVWLSQCWLACRARCCSVPSARGQSIE